MFIVNGVSGALLHCINFRVATDPACGSGNFLTETYLELRRLENKALSIINKGQARFVDVNLYDPIKVKLDQFYGIEINDFAVAVANTALFISEYQMLRETEAILNIAIDYLPLHSFNGIHEGNALRMDWNDVISSSECNYIMGNPPFLGHQWRTSKQIEDMKLAFPDLKKHGKLDYVCAWYNKSVNYMRNTEIEAAFVSTNSIVQGESISVLWKHLIDKGVRINFAYQSFIWANETKNSAHVHCVIIGFSLFDSGKPKLIFNSIGSKVVEHINSYLYEAPNIFIKNRGNPPDGYPKMTKGSQPSDGTNLSLNENEYKDLIKKYPDLKKYIRPYCGAREFLNNKERYCLWLKDCKPSNYLKIPFIKKRLELVKEFRKKSKTKAVRKIADSPHLFEQDRQPQSDYLFIPGVSSERRRYIPIGFVNKNVIASMKALIIPTDSLTLFGLLSSNVHNAWMRVIAGRLKSDYSYTPSVYNNFPFPKLNEKNKALIETTAKEILEARKNYPDWSLADLYGSGMPSDLRKAHQINDRAVMEAYGWDWKKMSEEDCVAELMKLYQEKVTE